MKLQAQKQHAETENEQFRLERQHKQQVQKEHKQVQEENKQVQKEHKQVLEEKELQRQNATSVLERLMMKEKRRRIITAIKVQAHMMHEMKKSVIFTEGTTSPSRDRVVEDHVVEVRDDPTRERGGMAASRLSD